MVQTNCKYEVFWWSKLLISVKSNLLSYFLISYITCLYTQSNESHVSLVCYFLNLYIFFGSITYVRSSNAKREPSSERNINVLILSMMFTENVFNHVFLLLSWILWSFCTCWDDLMILVKEESEKVGLKLNIQKTKIMASSPWQIRWGNNGNSERLYFFELQKHCRWWLQPWN